MRCCGRIVAHLSPLLQQLEAPQLGPSAHRGGFPPNRLYPPVPLSLTLSLRCCTSRSVSSRSGSKLLSLSVYCCSLFALRASWACLYPSASCPQRPLACSVPSHCITLAHPHIVSHSHWPAPSRFTLRHSHIYMFVLPHTASLSHCFLRRSYPAIASAW